jgi:hypothetical protein
MENKSNISSHKFVTNINNVIEFLNIMYYPVLSKNFLESGLCLRP